MSQVREIALFALNLVKTAATNEEALRGIVGRLGKSVGGATAEELNVALEAGVAARKKAGQGMQEAGKARP
jgi:hypothetical protein